MEMTLKEAWADFVFGLHQSGKWDSLTRAERQYIDKTNRDIKNDGTPLKKVDGLFKRHSPGVYKMCEITFTKTTKA